MALRLGSAIAWKTSRRILRVINRLHNMTNNRTLVLFCQVRNKLIFELGKVTLHINELATPIVTMWQAASHRPKQQGAYESRQRVGPRCVTDCQHLLHSFLNSQ